MDKKLKQDYSVFAGPKSNKVRVSPSGKINIYRPTMPKEMVEDKTLIISSAPSNGYYCTLKLEKSFSRGFLGGVTSDVNIIRYDMIGNIPDWEQGGITPITQLSVNKYRQDVEKYGLKSIYVDLETSGTDPHNDEILAISVTVLNNKIISVPNLVQLLGFYHDDQGNPVAWTNYQDTSALIKLTQEEIDEKVANQADQYSGYYHISSQDTNTGYTTVYSKADGYKIHAIDVAEPKKYFDIDGVNVVFSNLTQEQYAFIISRLLYASSELDLVGHNIKFDFKFMYHAMLKQGIDMRGVSLGLRDTMLAEVIMNKGKEGMKYGLGDLSMKYFKHEMDKDYQKYWIGKKNTTQHPKAAIRYAGHDTIVCAALDRQQEFNTIKLHSGLTKEFRVHATLEYNALVPLAITEYVGFPIDPDMWKKVAIENELECEDIKYQLQDNITAVTDRFTGPEDLFGMNEFTLNFDSPPQMLEFLQKDLGFTDIKDTKKETLAKLAEENELVAEIIAYRKKAKEVSTYGMSFLENINSKTGRVHSDYWQIADTGRLRSARPNLQNIPQNIKYRECFRPSKGSTFIICDYSSQESRILANHSKEENLLKFYNEGHGDLHSYVAQLLYPDTVGKVDLVDVKKRYPKERQEAKAANFALAYGGDGYTVANNLGVSVADGMRVEKAYFKAFPDLKKYFDTVHKAALRNGFVRIPGAGFTWLPHYDKYRDLKKKQQDYNLSEYNNQWLKSIEVDYKGIAYNYPIQGTAAAMTKYSDILLRTRLSSNARVVSYIHDELVVECDSIDAEEVAKLVSHTMEESAANYCDLIHIPANAEVSIHWKK